jgi:hypothetical protein
MSTNTNVTTYMSYLKANQPHLQMAIESLVQKYMVQPAANGYIDLIVLRKNAPLLLDELEQLPVAVEAASWWCLADNLLSPNCPHGMGGPFNQFGCGWFSECVQYKDFDVSGFGISLYADLSTKPHELARVCNRTLKSYLETTLPTEPFYSPCLQPGLWLHLPDEWNRLSYIDPMSARPWHNPPPPRSSSLPALPNVPS